MIFEDRWKSFEALWDSIYFSSSIWVSTSPSFEGAPLSIILLDWNLVCRAIRSDENTLLKETPPLVVLS